MPGIQSMKVTLKTEPLRWDFEKVAASIWRKSAMANYMTGIESVSGQLIL